MLVLVKKNFGPGPGPAPGQKKNFGPGQKKKFGPGTTLLISSRYHFKNDIFDVLFISLCSS
jgi:hypothetical protein